MCVMQVDEPERWATIEAHPSHEISTHGRVRSITRQILRSDGHTVTWYGQLRRQGTRPDGYKVIGIDRKTRLVHTLVLEAFVGPRPQGMECCHGPSGPSDNRLSNLRWDTPAENRKDRVRHQALKGKAPHD